MKQAASILGTAISLIPESEIAGRSNLLYTSGSITNILKGLQSRNRLTTDDVLKVLDSEKEKVPSEVAGVLQNITKQSFEDAQGKIHSQDI